MNDESMVSLVEDARSGCQESKNDLAGRVQQDLYTYIYRLTLDEAATSDICQEVLLEMCNSIHGLRNPGCFKPWLYKIAWAKVNNHYRSKKNKECMSIHDKNNLVDRIANKEMEGLKSLISKEIANTLVTSLGEMDPKQKNVLVLRCYENLSYGQIAEILECSEIHARLLFFRAKEKLRVKLHRKGITKASFLVLLCIFGRITSSADAAVTVSASSLKVGFVAATIGTLLSKVYLTVISLLAGLGIIAGTTTLLKSDSQNIYSQSARQQVRSFHLIEQAWDKSYVPNANLLMGKSLSRGAYEQWFFFPEGVDGPLFKMVQRWDPQVQNKLCGWRLDGDGQFYYHSGRNEIYHFNAPLASKDTLRFPCDSPEFCEFLDKMEGKRIGVDYDRDPNTGFLVQLHDKRFANANNFNSVISYNVLDETSFGNFRYNWPENAAFIDERDVIHKQGWTVYHITGSIQDTPITGRCRIPFVFNQRKDHPPLLELKVGSDLTLIDSVDGAFILDGQGNVKVCCASGSFFKGLIRPWYGIHTMDTVRRDAVESKTSFKMENINFRNHDYEKRRIILHGAPGFEGLRASILVDTDSSQIEKIEFYHEQNGKNERLIGVLEFVYPVKPENVMDMQSPQLRVDDALRGPDVGINWLFALANGTLGK